MVATVHHLECVHCHAKYPAQPPPVKDVSHACRVKGGRQVYLREVTVEEHRASKD